MSAIFFNLTCPCSQQATSFKKIGVTSEFKVFILWSCSKCGEEVILTLTLEELAKQMHDLAVSPDEPSTPIEEKIKYTTSDKKMLRALKIRTDDQDDENKS